ncbi:hypothetical protein K9M74_02105 [Candidatus Woesearchaeota archaeon]|nr:hypothetical protein [Candidatus Woesearchaeota archaeon]
MEETQNNGVVGVSGETFEQKVIRNVQGNFAVYKTTEVVGDKSFMPNLEWAEPEDVDKFFMFAKNLGVKVIYITEGEDEEDTDNPTKNTILQVGFLHQGIMHHIDYADDDDDDNVEYEDDEESEDEEDETLEYNSADSKQEEEVPTTQPSPQPIPQPAPQPTQQQQGLGNPQGQQFNQNQF